MFEVDFNACFLSNVLNFPLSDKLSSHTALRSYSRLFLLCLWLKKHSIDIHADCIFTKIVRTWWTILLSQCPPRMSRFNISFSDDICAVGLLANNHILPIFLGSHLIFNQLMKQCILFLLFPNFFQNILLGLIESLWGLRFIEKDPLNINWFYFFFLIFWF